MTLNIARLCVECSARGREKKRTQCYDRKERGHLQELGVDWKTPFKWEFQM